MLHHTWGPTPVCGDWRTRLPPVASPCSRPVMLHVCSRDQWAALVPSRLIRSSIGDNSRIRLCIKNRSFPEKVPLLLAVAVLPVLRTRVLPSRRTRPRKPVGNAVSPSRPTFAGKLDTSPREPHEVPCFPGFSCIPSILVTECRNAGKTAGNRKYQVSLTPGRPSDAHFSLLPCACNTAGSEGRRPYHHRV